MVNKALYGFGWEKYLTVLFLLLGTGFFSSGVITWIAANWDYFSKFQKLYAVQASLGTSVLLAAFFYLRESKRVAKERVKLVSAVFFFVAAVFVGALFALIGQIYQTGANAWQLFALWSALQVPLLLIMPNAGSALLLIVTLNVTAVLYGLYLNDLMMELLVGLNFVLLVLSEFAPSFFHDKNWRILSKCTNLALAFSLLGWSLENIRIFSNYTDYNSSWLVCVVFGVLIWAYKKYRADLFPLIVHFVGLIVSVDIILLRDNFGSMREDTVLLAMLLTLGAAIVGAIQLRNRFFKQNSALEHHWTIQLMFAFLALLSAGLLLAFIGLVSGEFETAVATVSVILFVSAVVLHYSKGNRYFIDMLLALSVVLLSVYFLIMHEGYSYAEESAIRSYQILTGLALYAAVIFYLNSALWIKTLSVLALLIAFLIEFDYFVYRYNDADLYASLFGQFVRAVLSWSILAALACFYAAGRAQREAVRHRLISLAWAFTLLVFGLFMQSMGTFLILPRFAEQAGELPQVNSLTELFNVVTADAFSRFDVTYWLVKLFRFAAVFAPLILYFVLSRAFKPGKLTFWFVASVVALFCVGFSASTVIVFCFGLLLLAYSNASRVLFGAAILALIGTLAAYYYMLSIPLLYKSFLLMAFGLIFALTALILHKQNGARAEEATQSAVGFSRVLWVRPAFALAVLTGILSLANYSIVKYEDVLNNGRPIVLKLAPVDPRSLMQGDYMELNYEILNELRAHLSDDEAEQSTRRAYALIQEDEKGVAKLCRIERVEPTAFDGCRADVYLPVNTNSWQPRLPSQDYFFAEGKGAYYAQAEYGEYRFKDGTALLFRLLDKDLKPL